MLLAALLKAADLLRIRNQYLEPHLLKSTKKIMMGHMHVQTRRDTVTFRRQHEFKQISTQRYSYYPTTDAPPEGRKITNVNPSYNFLRLIYHSLCSVWQQPYHSYVGSLSKDVLSMQPSDCKSVCAADLAIWMFAFWQRF